MLAAGEAPAAAGEVDRRPPRAHAHGQPLARALPRRRGRLRRRRHRPSPPSPHRRRLRRVLHVAADRLHGRRHGARHPSGPVSHPQLLGRRLVGLHQQVPARGVPRRLASCGLLHDRADDGRRRRGGRHRRCRGAPAQPRARRRVSLHVGHRHGVRLRVVRRVAGEGARGGGLRGLAAPAGSGAGGGSIPRHRRVDLHRADRPHVRGVQEAGDPDHVRVRDERGRSRPVGPRDGPHHRPLARPGARNVDRPDRSGRPRRRPGVRARPLR